MRAFSLPVLLKSGAAACAILYTTGLAPEPDARPQGATETAAERLERIGIFLKPHVFARAAVSQRPPTMRTAATSPLATPPSPPKSGASLLETTVHEDWATAHRLIESGAAVDVADNSGLTPLMVAAMHGSVETVRELLAHNANADAIDLGGRSALHYAISATHRDAVELLLPHVGQIQARTSDGRDAVALALDSRDLPIIQAVLNRCPPTLQWSAASRRALDEAFRAGNNELVRLLLTKHPAPPTPEGRTAPLLAYSIVTDNTPLFKTLLACGADPNVTVPTPVDKEFMKLVRSSYLRMYLEADSGVTPLMLSAGLGKVDYVKALLDAGAERNRMTAHEKMLALYFAANGSEWKVTQMLLGNGPQPEQLRIEISLKQQRASVIKDGAAIFTTTCSTGRAGYSTPAGHYVVTDKDRDHRSTIYKCPMPYFMRLNCRDFGMHEGVVPNYPASHGCIRLPGAAARKLFSEIPVGTLVTIN